MSTDLQTHTQNTHKLDVPAQYSVVLLNDDFTPMEFVVAVLMQVFRLPASKAEEVMWTVHQAGRGVVGTYSREVAETKVFATKKMAEQEGHPFLCVVERTV